MADDDGRLSRRELLVALGVVTVGGIGGARLLAAQGGGSASAPGAPTAEPTTRPSRASTPEPRATPEPVGVPTEEPEPSPEPEPEPEPELEPLEPAPAYQPVAGEVLVEAKVLAATVAQTVLTYGAGEEAGDVVARSLVRPRGDVDLARIIETTAPLIMGDAESVGRALYPQLGGLGQGNPPRSASVMVVTEQRLREPGGERTVTRTIDVRLVATEEGWFLDTIASAGGDELPRPRDLSPEAVAVLDDERIELPDSARWDIYADRVDPRLLGAMVSIADVVPYAVSCIRSGHPLNVFGTDRESNHAAGRAVDIWRVGDEPVVSQQPAEDTPAWQLNRWAFDTGVIPEIGGPWAFDGHGGHSFSDPVHLDHLHVAFHAPPEDRSDASEPAPEG